MTAMEFKDLFLSSSTILLLLQISSLSAQLDLPSMPGPPYPDPRGQNRWGVKFDPRVHGPPFDMTQERGGKIGSKQNSYQRPGRPPPLQQDSYQRPAASPQQSQSQEIAFQRPPPPYQNNNFDNRGAPAGFSQNPNGLYNQNNFVQASNQQQQQQSQPQQNNLLPQQQQFYNAWNSQYNKGSTSSNPWNNIHNNYNNHNKAIRPPTALTNDKTKEQQKADNNYWNRIMGFFSSNANKNAEAQVQPSNFRYQVDFNYPRRPGHQLVRNSKGRPGRPPQPRNKRKPKTQRNWKIFTTIGKGLDAVNGGVNSVRKVVKGTTGRALAKGVKIGGKVAYVGAQTLAKVITKASKW